MRIRDFVQTVKAMLVAVRPVINFLARLATMVALPVIAFSSVGKLGLLPVFVVVLSFAKTRKEVGVLALAYFLSAGQDLPKLVETFFSGSSWALIYGLPLGLAMILTLPWMIFDPKAEGWKRILLFLAAITVFTIFPVGYLAWHNPLFAAAHYFPGMGMIGVVGMAIFYACLTAPKSGKYFLALSISLMLWSQVKYQPEDIKQMPYGWFGLSTSLGQISTDRKERGLQANELNRQIKRAIDEGARVIFTPESVLYWTQGSQIRLSETVVAAKEVGAKIFVGADVPNGEKRWRNAMLDLVSGEVVDESRMPMPAGVYRVFGGAPLRPFASDLLDVMDKTVAMSICFEDLIIWPHFGLLMNKSDVMVSVGNVWSLELPTIITKNVSGDALAKIAGVQRISAQNGKAIHE